MPHERTPILPRPLQKPLPKSALNLFRKAYGSAMAEHLDSEKAIATALAVVKSRYQQDASGKWIKKDAPGVSSVHVDGVQWQKPKKNPNLAKGIVIKSDEAQRYTLGVVYEPDVEDTQGDLATAEEIERWCRDFNRKRLGTGRDIAKRRIRKGALGIQHQDWSDEHGEIIESYIAPCDMRIDSENGNIAKITKGTWLMGCIWSPENWTKILNGEITGLSMGGSARREDA